MSDFEFFLEYEKKLAAQRALQVASDPLIFADIKNWDSLDVAQKKSFIERYKRLCEKVMHSGMLNLEFYEEAPKNGRISFGNFRNVDLLDGWGKPIRINVHPEVLQIGLRAILDTPAHELTHNYQCEIIVKPAILPELFRDSIPSLMRDNMANYIRWESDPARYRQ